MPHKSPRSIHTSTETQLAQILAVSDVLASTQSDDVQLTHQITPT